MVNLVRSRIIFEKFKFRSNLKSTISDDNHIFFANDFGYSQCIAFINQLHCRVSWSFFQFFIRIDFHRTTFSPYSIQMCAHDYSRADIAWNLQMCCLKMRKLMINYLLPLWKETKTIQLHSVSLHSLSTHAVSHSCGTTQTSLILNVSIFISEPIIVKSKILIMGIDSIDEASMVKINTI